MGDGSSGSVWRGGNACGSMLRRGDRFCEEGVAVTMFKWCCEYACVGADSGLVSATCKLHPNYAIAGW
jgi:hypothetical protein